LDGEKAIKQAIENSNTRFYKAFESFSILRESMSSVMFLCIELLIKELDSFEIRNNRSSTSPYHKLLLCYHI
jgi:hypothetical protein